VGYRGEGAACNENEWGLCGVGEGAREAVRGEVVVLKCLAGGRGGACRGGHCGGGCCVVVVVVVVVELVEVVMMVVVIGDGESVRPGEWGSIVD